MLIRYLVSIAMVILLWPTSTLALAYDLSINNTDISFSTDNLLVGQAIRLYVRIRNIGAEDMKGYITFFQGNQVIGDSQQIAIRGGNYGDAWVDFRVPDSSFNILARIQGTQPVDQNSANDQAITTMFSVDIDTDGDKIGDNADPDDDNDGLTDEQEIKLGTDSKKRDSDGDGVNDGDDYYPLDATRSQKQEPIKKVEKNDASLANVTTNNNEILKIKTAENDTNDNQVVEVKNYDKDFPIDDSSIQLTDRDLSNNPLTIATIIRSWYFWSLLAIIILIIFLLYYYRKLDWQLNRIIPRLVKDQSEETIVQDQKIIDLRNIRK